MSDKGYRALPVDPQEVPQRSRGNRTNAWVTRMLEDFKNSNDECWKLTETTSLGRIDTARKLKTAYQSIRNNIKYHQRDMFATMRSGDVYVFKGKDPNGHDGHQIDHRPFTRTKR